MQLTAKASYALLLCEMERGRVNWQDTARLDRIRRAHAQKHHVGPKQNWVKNSDSSKKPWFCKFYQTGTCSFVKDHDHICAFCLGQGKIMGHAEKDCHSARRSQNQGQIQNYVTSKNEGNVAQL